MNTENFEKNYDVFHSFLVRNAEYSGHIELPKIKTSGNCHRGLLHSQRRCQSPAKHLRNGLCFMSTMLILKGCGGTRRNI